MLAAKGLNKEQIGKKVEDAYWKRIDDFWMARCEAKLQQERLKQNKAEFEKQIWDRVNDRLEAIKKAAGGGKTAGGPESFFYTESNIPRGWKLSRSRRSLEGFKPASEPNNKRLSQRFIIYPAEFIEKVEPNGGSQLYYPDGKSMHPDKQRTTLVLIWIAPSVETDNTGNAYLKWNEWLVELVEKKGGWQPDLKVIKKLGGNGIDVGYFTREVIRNEPRNSYQCEFVKGPWLVFVGTWGHSKFDDAAVAEQLVTEVASRIPEK